MLAGTPRAVQAGRDAHAWFCAFAAGTAANGEEETQMQWSGVYKTRQSGE